MTRLRTYRRCQRCYIPLVASCQVVLFANIRSGIFRSTRSMVRVYRFFHLTARLAALAASARGFGAAKAQYGAPRNSNDQNHNHSRPSQRNKKNNNHNNIQNQQENERTVATVDQLDESSHFKWKNIDVSNDLAPPGLLFDAPGGPRYHVRIVLFNRVTTTNC